MPSAVDEPAHIGRVGTLDGLANLAQPERLDRVYTKLLRDLHAAWQPGGNLAAAIDTMFRLRAPARELIRTEIPGRGGATFGPSWRYVA